MKLIIKILPVILLVFLLSVRAYAVDTGDYYEPQMEASGAGELYSLLDADTKDALKELGIEGVDFSSLYDITPEKVFRFGRSIINGRIKEPVKAAAKLFSVIIIISIGESFIPDDEKLRSIVNVAGELMCVAVVSVPVWQAIGSAVSSVGMCCAFMKALIPVLAGAVIASGNPAVALSFQSWAFAAAQFISSICQSCILPVVGSVIAVDISGAIMPEYKLKGITSLIKKTVISVLSFTATLYVSFLGINGILANTADTVTNKGIKLIISSTVPVVGGALSEAYSGIVGSLTMVKSTVGIFGIVSVAAITLPSVIYLLFWIFIFKLASAAGEVFAQKEMSALFEAFSSAITLLNVVLVFNGILFIISMALLLNLK